MLNRRYLRTKVMQALYAFFQSDDDRMDIAERNLIKSIEKLYELYIYQLSLLVELVDFAKRRMEENKLKHIPSAEDLNPNCRFIENRFVKQLENNKNFQLHFDELKINWSEEQDLFRSIYQKLIDNKSFIAYMDAEESSYAADKKIIISILRKFIISDDALQNYFEDKNIYWADDFLTVSMMVLKTIDSFKEEDGELFALPELYKNEDRNNADDDKNFVIDLFRKTIINANKYEKLISEKTTNWEVERIAIVDNILIKMALVELLEFPSIPIKVTLNEYIEISKGYSSDKSKVFINGILDKLIDDLKENKSIKKIGRGLIDKN
ncbi:MAG: transcription antitermination factor NusB [Bacteroidetes bacterium]|nr:transcription antitermination factor NusB [Bacteroidota bacterium]